MPSLADPNFSKTLTYICEHNNNGALGIVVNRPTTLTVHELCERLDVSVRGAVGSMPVYEGGPVQKDRGFVLHRPIGNWQSTLVVHETLGLTTSRDVLQALADGRGPDQLLISLGYAGWGAGQLENEIKQNAWLTVNAAPEVIFDTPVEERVPAAMRLLGIEFGRLSDVAGHA